MEKVKFYSNLLKLNLQRFADEGQDGEGGANTGNESTDTNDDSDAQAFHDVPDPVRIGFLF